MSGLARKEWREWGLPCAGLLLLLSLAWCLIPSAADVLIVPRQEPTLSVLATASLLGLALGYAQLVRERARGTLSYLAHREGGRRALLQGKLAVGIPLALALGMLPPLALLLQESFGPLAAVLQPERAFEHALAGLVALPAYAAGLLIAQITPSGFLTFAQGLLACVGCSLYSLWLPLPVFRMSAWSIPLFVLGELALAAALLALARALFLRSHDRDVVLPVRLQSGAALFALLLLVYPAWWAFSSSVQEGQSGLFNGYPLVVRSFDGQYSVMERDEYHARLQGPGVEKRTHTLPNGAVATESNPTLVYNPAPPVEVPMSARWQILLRDHVGLASPWRWSEVPIVRPASEGQPGAGPSGRWHLDSELGVVHEFHRLERMRGGRPDPTLPPPEHTILRRPDGRPFSRSTLIVADGMKPSLLVDRGDKTLWTFEFSEAWTRLAEQGLPDGDRLVDVEMKKEWAPDGWYAAFEWEPVLVGARGRYQWTATGFQPVNTLAAKPWWLRYCRSEVGEASLAAATVRLREIDENGNVGPDSAIVFEQRYEPSGLRQIGKVALMRVALLCGPPVQSAQRLLTNSGASLMRGVLPSPAWMPKDSAGVHLLHVLLGAAFGVLTWRHLARRGATRAECVLWSVLVVLFGGFLLAFLRMLAPRPEASLQESPERAQRREHTASMATV